MERKILILCQERPQLSDLRREWQKDGIFARIVSGVGEVACELSRNTDYLLVIIFSDGQEYLTSLKLTRGLTNAPIMVLNRQYDSAEKIAAIKAGADEYIKWSDSYVEEIFASSYALIRRLQLPAYPVQAGMEAVIGIPKVIVAPHLTVKLFIRKYP